MLRRTATALSVFPLCAFVAAGFVSARPVAAALDATGDRNDYVRPAFAAALDSGLKHFYLAQFSAAQADFERALAVVPDNTLAISFLDASAAQRAGALDTLTNLEEDAVSGAPKNYVDHVRLAFSYLFQTNEGRDRSQDARDELNAALALDPDAAAAHDGLGIMRFNDRSANRAKTEFLAALRADPNDVLAREYLGQLYQSDLRDPQRGLSYVIDVPNLVPQYADIAFHIGSLLSDLHQDDAAIAYLQRGVSLDVDHVGEAGQHGYTLMARIYIDEHRLPEAKRMLDRALAADVDTIYARTLLVKIDGGDYGATPSPAPSASGT